MNILIIQEKGRHLENQEFREALNFQRSLKSIGIESVVWGLNYSNFSTPLAKIAECCDVILLLENYELNSWIPDLSKFHQLKLFWSIDSHCALEQHLRTCRSHRIHICLNAIQSHQCHFKQYSTTYYFPNSYPHDLIFPMDQISKKNDIGFCGNVLSRGPWIDLLKNHFGIKTDVMVIGNNMVRAINSYKIHFNRNIDIDLNYRTFETLGCRTMLITNETENLTTFFRLGVDLVVYENERDLIEKVNYYKDNEEEREKIAQSGYENVLEHHTYAVRAQQLTDIINAHI